MTNTLPAASAVHETLRRQLPSLDASTRNTVVRTLVQNGHAHDDTTIGTVFAAADRSTMFEAISAAESAKIDKNRIPTLARIKATLLRWNYPWSDTALINLQKLDACADGRDVTERLAIKADMRRCQLLPRYN